MDFRLPQELEVGAEVTKNRKGASVLLCDVVKDDSGSYAVFAQQKSHAAQMIPGCAGQVSDAVSACAQIRMEDAPTLLTLPKSERPDVGFGYHDTNGPKTWPSVEEPVGSS